MRPLQYDSRPSRATDNSITQAAAAARNHDAAITMRFAAPRHKPACMIMYVRTWQQNMTTIMQPFHCDQQPQIPKYPITTHTHKRIESSLEPPLHCGKAKKHQNDPSPHPRHTAALHRRLHPLYPKSAKFRAPASSPKQAPCNIHAAICIVM